MQIMRNIVQLVILCFCNIIFAQNKDIIGNQSPYYTIQNCFTDTMYKQSLKSGVIKTNNVMQATTYWRTISLDFQNKIPLKTTNNYCTQINLFEIIKFGIIEKNLKAFINDDFSNAPNSFMTIEEFKKQLIYTDTINQFYFDENGNETNKIVINNGYLSGKQVKQFLLKEDWYLDSYSGKLNKKIIVLAPLKTDLILKKIVPICWIYFDEWVNFLKCFYITNQTDDELITYYDALTQGIFLSKVSKENNLKNEKLKNSYKGNQSLIESEYIKEKVRNSELDLFQY